MGYALLTDKSGSGDLVVEPSLIGVPYQSWKRQSEKHRTDDGPPESNPSTMDRNESEPDQPVSNARSDGGNENHLQENENDEVGRWVVLKEHG